MKRTTNPLVLLMVTACMLTTGCTEPYIDGACHTLSPEMYPLPLDTTGYNSVAAVLSNFRYRDTTAYPVRVVGYVSHHSYSDDNNLFLTDDPNHNDGTFHDALYCERVPSSVDKDEEGLIRLTGRIVTDFLMCNYIPTLVVTEAEPIK